MIWRRLFPAEGGGALRRYLRARKTLIAKALDSEHVLKGPITLFDFAHPDDAVDAAAAAMGPTKGGWRISDDEVIGGFSRGSMSLIHTSEDYRRVMMGEKPLPISFQQKDATTTKHTEQSDGGEGDFSYFIPFIRWKGTTDTRIGESSRAVRSGFCAIRSPEFPFSGVDLENKYNALEITCRSDGRIYTVNLKVSSYFPDDLYQAIISVPPTHAEKDKICNKTGGEFAQLVLPFRDFLLTSAGRVREVQRELDGGVRIEHIGITLMDGEDGDFEFDLARIRAINYYHDEILGEDDEDAPY